MKNNKSRTSIAVVLTTAVLSFLLYGCPSPLDETKLAVYQDLDAPLLTINSPTNYSEYGTVIQLSGTVEDSSLSSVPDGTEISVSFSIDGTDISGSTVVNLADGSFQAAIDVSSLSGDKLLGVSTSDMNGNESSVSINIIKPADGGDISGFTVTPGNKQVTIEWDEVPLAESYSLLQTSYGISVDGVTSPYVWTGLDNGIVYNFELTAVMPEELGDDAISHELSGMPLSRQTLKPWISRTDYQSLTLEWTEYPDISRYNVERSESASGPWEVRQSLSANSIYDDRVETNTRYYYRVRPSDFDEITSYYAAAEPGIFDAEIHYKSTDYYTCGLDISGSYCFLATQFEHVAVTDISDPLSPGKMTYIDTPYGLTDIRIVGDYAYLSCYGKLVIWDISNPLNPETLSTLTFPDHSSERPQCIEVTEDPVTGKLWVFMPSQEAGLACVDVSNPENPGSIFYKDTTDQALDVSIDYPYAYVADRNDGLAIIDITNPGSNEDDSAPAYKSFYNAGSGPSANAVAVKGDYAFVSATSEDLVVVDITSPGSDGTITAADYTSCGTGTYLADITVSGKWAYLTETSHNTLITVDISDPSSPGAPVSRSLTNATNELLISDSYIYMAAGGAGLAVTDCSQPLSPDEPVYLSADGSPNKVTVSGSTAYIAAMFGGVAVADISAPSSPSVLAYITSTDACPKDTAVSGGMIYIADYDKGLGIADITDPANPGIPVYLATSDNAYGIAVAGDYAYLSVAGKGLDIVDISDPDNPSEPVNLDTDGFTIEVAISGDYAYLADANSGLAIVDISDPENPGSPDYLPIAGSGSGSAMGVDIAGNYAYVAAGGGGLVIVDISDPTDPTVS